ncbi:hypothetical protein AMS68_006376 [Peltaster fructicola]|uniref:Uncharacterized protein n=1 Tax=Peltaster fructicola TaxID=286661 RepID=A0A6H0Y1W4_9PEZI|nr:hypothetical protein AMS68_006376 [Peltaster fructicola]
MATHILRQHILPLGGLAAGLALVPSRVALAEDVVAADPLRELRKRKPIYDSPSDPSIREIAASTPLQHQESQTSHKGR